MAQMIAEISERGVWAKLHTGYVQGRRAGVLAQRLCDIIPPNCRVLDLGCGDGQISGLIKSRRPDLEIRGIDILVRDMTYVPVSSFDGTHIPEPCASYDVVMLIDVLHHCDSPEAMIREAQRVAKKTLIIKDVMNDQFLSDWTLRMMDIAANRRYRVPCPFNFWPHKKWMDTFDELGARVSDWRSELGLYPWPANLFFERSMHFIARLDI